MESNPLFIAAKPYIDQLLRDLANTSIGSGIAHQILTGDLSGVIGILEGYHLANEVANLINCENQETGVNIDPSMLGLSPEISFEDMTKMERSLSQLRDNQNMILDSIPEIMNKVMELEQGLIPPG